MRQRRKKQARFLQHDSKKMKHQDKLNKLHVGRTEGNKELTSKY